MGETHFKVLKLVLLFSLSEICAAQNDITLSVFTVTSKSMTVRWSAYNGASSYKVTARPKNLPENSVFAHFGGSTVMGSVNSLSPNTMYYMQVQAMDRAFNVLSSAEILGTTAPEAPTIEQAYSKQSDSITTVFTEVVGATGYILRASSEAAGFFSETMVTGSPATVLGLEPYTDYSLSVLSVNAGGKSQPSQPVQIRTVVVAPALNATSPSNDTILVAWSPVEHAVLYTLCIIREDSDARHKLNTSESAVAFDGLEAGTTYCVKATAWDAEGRAGDDFTVCKITRPPSPDSVHVLPTQGRSIPGIAVFWQAAHGADAYLARSSTGQNCTLAAAAADSHCVIAPLSCGRDITVTVTAENEAGPSVASDPALFVTFPCPPEHIWVEEPVAGSCQVAWSEVSGADYYMAFVKRDDGAEEQCNTTDAVCRFPCRCGYTFLTTVFAYNHAGSSPPGDVLNYTTVPCCPEDITINLISTETLEIMWLPVRGAELYETTAGQTDDVIHCNDTSPVCALSDLRCNSLYSVVVKPCSELRGCNHTCKPHTHGTAPCPPDILTVTQVNSTSVSVSFSAPNGAGASYTVRAVGSGADARSCHTTASSCLLSQLPCGVTYDVSAVADTSAGRSLPSYSVPLDTAPCCPSSIDVDQVTQAMTNVTWSPAAGARSYVTSLASPRGRARCRALDTHCLLGCVTCGTNYSVSVEAVSRTGHKSECSYQGFSSSPCCPSSVKLYRLTNSSLRVSWRPSGQLPQARQQHAVDLYAATGANYTCSPAPGASTCDLPEVTCGDVYTVVVSPMGRGGAKVSHCPRRVYSVSCAGSNVGMVIYRGKRSVE